MKEELQKIIQGDVDDSDETLTKYSHDASIFEVRPKFVIYPKDSTDVQALVKWVSQNKEKYPDLSITARCAGTDMSGGSVNESIILDFSKYMNQLVNFPNEQKLITVQPGMFYRDFEKITLSKNLLMPSYTASKNICAVGGMVANNSGGEKTLVYGKTEEYIESLKVVFTDGNEYTISALTPAALDKKITENSFESAIYKKIREIVTANATLLKEAKPKVTKNSAGYYLWNIVRPDGTFDLNRIIIGSQGTLGIITEITFKLVQPKPFSKLLVVFLRDMNLVPDLVNTILKHTPETLESYDDKTFLLVLKYIRSFAKLLGLKNFFRLIFSFGPEILMTLRHGFPKFIMLVEFTADTQAEADAKAFDAQRELRTVSKIGVHIARDAFEAQKYWTIRHEAFNLIRYHLKKMKSEPFVDDVIVRPERLPEFFPALYKILNAYKSHMTFAIGGHSGDGNMHIYTLLNPKDPSLNEIVLKVSDQVYDLVMRLEGSITAEHNDGLIRTPYLQKMYGEAVYNLFKEVKHTFDPKNIFNPGKKVGATKEYLASHITKLKA